MMSRAILFLGPCLVRLFDRAGSVLVLVAPNIARPVELSDSVPEFLPGSVLVLCWHCVEISEGSRELTDFLILLRRRFTLPVSARGVSAKLARA